MCSPNTEKGFLFKSEGDSSAWLPRIREGLLDIELDHILRSSGGGEVFVPESMQEVARNELGRDAGEGPKHQPSKYPSKTEWIRIIDTTLHPLVFMAPSAERTINTKTVGGGDLHVRCEWREETQITSACSASALASPMAPHLIARQARTCGAVTMMGSTLSIQEAFANMEGILAIPSAESYFQNQIR